MAAELGLTPKLAVGVVEATALDSCDTAVG